MEFKTLCEVVTLQVRMQKRFCQVNSHSHWGQSNLSPTFPKRMCVIVFETKSLPGKEMLEHLP